MTGSNSSATFPVVALVHYTTESSVADDKIVKMVGTVTFDDDTPGSPDVLASRQPDATETATAVNFNLSVSSSTLQRVLVNGTAYGSGITTVLTISTGAIPVSSITLTSGGTGATGLFYETFYDSVQQTETPKFSLAAHSSKTIILTIGLDQNSPQASGNYTAQITAKGTVVTSSGNSTISKDYLPAVTVSNMTLV